MGLREKIKSKLIDLFFEYEDEMTEEEMERSRNVDRLLNRLFRIVFIINTCSIVYLFFAGSFNVFNILDLGLLLITISLGIFLLYSNRKGN